MIGFELKVILVFLTAHFSALFILPKLANIAQRIGLVDEPNSRKIHKTPRPLVGGIGMVISATFSALLFIPIKGLRGFFLGLALLLLIGFLDDFREVGHRQKFLAQIAATALLMYFSKVSLLSFGDLVGLGEIDLSWSAPLVWAVTVFCVVGVINAVNMADGLDGLAGGASFLAFLTFAIHSSLIGDDSLMLLNLAMAGAVLGFLKFNWFPSAMFMGDAGSLCLGFSLAFMALALTQGEGLKVSPVVPLLVLAVPITDTVVVMIRRIFRGASPFKADQIHLHHILLRYGFGRITAVQIILLISILMCLLSLLGPLNGFSDTGLFAVYLLYAILFVAASRYIVRAYDQGRQLREGEHLLDRLPAVKAVKGWFRLSHIARRVARYPVNLPLVCQSLESGRRFDGTVLNISSDGCMARISDLDRLDDQMQVEITFQPGQSALVVRISAEHLWLQQRNDEMHHGFRFGDDPLQRERLASLLRRLGEGAASGNPEKPAGNG